MSKRDKLHLLTLPAICSGDCGTGKCMRPNTCLCSDGQIAPSCTAEDEEGDQRQTYHNFIGKFPLSTCFLYFVYLIIHTYESISAINRSTGYIIISYIIRNIYERNCIGSFHLMISLFFGW